MKDIEPQPDEEFDELPADVGITWSPRLIIFTLLLCMAVAVLGIFGFLFYKEYRKQGLIQTATVAAPIPNAKIYSNDYYGFEFNYPGSWSQVIGSYVDGDYFFSSEPINFIQEYDPGQALLEVQTYDNLKNLPLPDWLTYQEQNYWPPATITNGPTLSDNGIAAQQLYFIPKKPQNNINFWDLAAFAQNERIYVFILETDSPQTNTKYQPIFNSIVTSTKFYHGFGT